MRGAEGRRAARACRSDRVGCGARCLSADRAGRGACRCKAEEGVDAEPRRGATTRQMRVPRPATPA
ncbi:hypothetical protein CFC35_09255 [Streptomyces sp. FBKL.4005]|nr:hypothetical protein CFC35_09255 [Streptomyces sp. FBKL.4005]